MEFNNNQAIYLQIVTYVCDQIQIQKWLANEKIASVRELAVTLEVNPNTVMRSYEYLQQQGIIYTRRGMGYFVNSDARKKIVEARKEAFLNEELPQVFRKMQIMGISPQEFLERYEKFNRIDFKS